MSFNFGGVNASGTESAPPERSEGSVPSSSNSTSTSGFSFGNSGNAGSDGSRNESGGENPFSQSGNSASFATPTPQPRSPQAGSSTRPAFTPFSTSAPSTPEKGFSLVGGSTPAKTKSPTSTSALVVPSGDCSEELCVDDVLKILGLEDQGHDWFTTEALALACSGERLGGMRTNTELENDDIETYFPTASLVQLLNAFPRRPKSEIEADKTLSTTAPSKTRTSFVDEVCQRLDLSNSAGRTLVARFLASNEEVGLGVRRANARRREILRVVRRSSAKRGAVEQALGNVRTFAELDAIDSVVGLVSLNAERFRATLQADVKLARDNSNEIVFGLCKSEALLKDVERRFQNEQAALLNTMVLMARAADDNDNKAKSNEIWHNFAVRFVDEQCETVMDHVLSTLERKDLSDTLEKLLLRILFHMPVTKEKKLALRLLRSKRTSLITRVPYISRVLVLLSKLRAGYSDDLKEAVESCGAPAISLAWSIFAIDGDLFESSYSSGFEDLENIRRQPEFAGPLRDIIISGMENFGIHEVLDNEKDCIFIAKLCATTFATSPEDCDFFWREENHPLRKLLEQLQNYPSAFLELCGALVSSENSARYALTYVGKKIRLENLALLCNLVKYLDYGTVASFDIMTTTRNVVRSHINDPRLVETLRNIAEKFPQHVLTVLANEADQSSVFPVLTAMRRELEKEITTGKYSGLMNGLHLISMLVLQVEREHYSSELHVAFEDAGTHCTRADLSRNLNVLGYRGDIDNATLRKLVPSDSPDEIDLNRLLQLLRVGEGSFFRVLSLTLQGRRSQTKQFVFQAVKLVREVFRSHRGWRFSSQKQRWDIGTQTTHILHRCVEMPFELDGVRAKVMDDLMNDTATQDALSANIFSLKIPRATFAQELVATSLDLLAGVLSLEGFGTQKITLLCRQDLAANVASYIGFPSESDRITCEFPLQRLAVRVLENFVVSLDAFRRARHQQKASGGVPSVVAMLSKSAMLLDDVATSIANGETSTLGLLTTSLELEPGLAAMLLQNDAILENILDILRDTSNFEECPRLYLMAMEFLGTLWYKRYTSIIARLLELEPKFWTHMSFSLYQDIDEDMLLSSTPKVINAQKNQICARAWALEIMTLEMETSGVGGAFMELMRDLRNEDRDTSWLNQYPVASVSLHRSETLSVESSSVDLSAFVQNHSGFVTPNLDPFLFERRQSRFGLVACQQYDVDMLQRVFPGEETLAKEVRSRNCALALSEAQLMLLRAWKTYMETRCLISWEDQPNSPSDLNTPVDGSFESPGTRRKRSFSNTESKHWGDVTSYTLVAKLAANLREAEDLGNEHQQCYLREVVEMFTSMLHFKIFERCQSSDNSMSSLLLDAHAFIPQGNFRKRSREIRGDKLVLDSDDSERPGAVQLIERIFDCLVKILEFAENSSVDTASKSRSFVLEVVRSLLAGLLMLFEVAGDDEANTQSSAKLAEKRVSSLEPLAKMLTRYADETEIVDLCLPLLSLIISELTKSNAAAMKTLVDQQVFTLLQKTSIQYSEAFGRRYADRQGLYIWLERNGLSDLSVKVLSATTPSNATKGNEGLVASLSQNDDEGEYSGAASSTALVTADTSSSLALTTVDEEDASDFEAKEQAKRDTKQKENETRLREIARQLGYKHYELRSKHRSSRNYRDLVGSKASGYSDEDGLVDISVIRLFMDFGITSVNELRTLDHAALQEMGIYKPSDRRRLLDIIDQRDASGLTGISSKRQTVGPTSGRSGDENDATKRKPISRKVGFEAAQELKRGLLRIQMILHIFNSAVLVDQTTVGAHLARLNVLRGLASDPLLRCVAGDKPFASSMDNRDNAASIAFRGYSVQGERDPAHLVWCEALQLTASLLESNENSKENRNVELALEFVANHRGTILATLQAYKHADSVMTLGALDEALRTTNLMRALSKHVQRWRLHGELYAPLLTAAWTMLHELVVGSEGVRRPCFLEEFVRTFFTGSKAVPRLCICTRPVTPLEIEQDRQPVMESLQRKPLVGTPRASMALMRTASVVEELESEQEAPASSSKGGVVSQLDDGDISVLHVTIEYRICTVVQQLLALFRSNQIVKKPCQLQSDEHSSQTLPVHDWGKAMIPFPLGQATLRQTQHQHYHYEGRPRSYSGSGDANFYSQGLGETNDMGSTPNIATLLSLLGYTKYRLNLAANMGGSGSSEDLRHPRSERWQKMLSYLSTNALYLMLNSLELSLHERERIKAQVIDRRTESIASFTLSEHVFDYLQKKACEGSQKICHFMNKLNGSEPRNSEIVDLLSERIKDTLQQFDVRADESLSSERNLQPTMGREIPNNHSKTLALLEKKRGPSEMDSIVTSHSEKRVRSARSRKVCMPNYPTHAVVIWIPGPQDHPASWEAIFRDFGMPHVCFIIPDLCTESVDSSIAPGLDETLLLPGGSKVIQRVLAEAAEEMNRFHAMEKKGPSKQSSNLSSSSSQARVASRNSFPALRELFALITARYEDRDLVLEAARYVCDIVRDQRAQDIPPGKILLGGFQTGGSFALLCALLLAIDPDPIVVGAVSTINSYLPLASELCDSLLHSLLTKPQNQRLQLPKIMMRNGALDTNVKPELAEVTARALHAIGASVNFDTAQNLDHSQWTLDEMKLVWESLLQIMETK